MPFLSTVLSYYETALYGNFKVNVKTDSSNIRYLTLFCAGLSSFTNTSRDYLP